MDENKIKLYFTNQTVDRQLARTVELKIEQSCKNLILENPFYDGEAKELKGLDTKGKSDLSFDEICGADLRKIRDSSGLLAYMSNDRDIGSNMEIAICSHSWGKPVYIIATTDNHFNHPWIQYFATRLFKNEDEFINWWNSK
jgi:hypothetical protein